MSTRVQPLIPGDSLWHVLDVLRTKKVEYPKVEIAWDVEVRADPFASPSRLAITPSLSPLGTGLVAVESSVAAIA
jgi:hypothetical protein